VSKSNGWLNEFNFEVVEYDSTIFLINYYLMMLIGVSLILLAFREFLMRDTAK